MAWVTPKTNWVGTDRFYATDWNRIVGNVEYIADELSVAYTPFSTHSDGTLLKAGERTAVTDLIETLLATLGSAWNRDYVAPRKSYGSAWNSRDLNTIESLLLGMKQQIDGTITNGVVCYAGEELICGDNISTGLL